MKKIINNEKVFTESKGLRCDYVDNIDVIDKIKTVAYLSKDLVLTVEMVANYYEVSKKAINTIIERNREELEEDGISVLKGDKLKEFKTILCYPQDEDTKYDVEIDNSKIMKTTQMTILTKRAMLRIGMLLTTSGIAIKVRNYLLNLEENSTDEQKKWAMQREIGKVDRKRMTSAISSYINPSNRFVYSNYTNMIYKALFNKEAKVLLSDKGLKDNDSLRNSFNGEELRLIDEAETIVTALVTLGFTYEYTKEQLFTKYNSQSMLKGGCE